MEDRCPFIEFYCNGCEQEPCICAEHGDSRDVCRALYPDYPDESTKREPLSLDWSLEFCVEGGFETCLDYQRARAEAAEARVEELEEGLRACVEADGFAAEASAICRGRDMLAKIKAAQEAE